MNIWIVNPYDNLPSEGNRAQRYWLMAEAFVRAGHRVVYWTSDFSHATKEKRLKVEGRRLNDGIEVLQIPTLPYKKNICLARIRSHKKLARDFERQAGSRVERGEHVDLIVASTPPLGLCDAARKVAKACGALFVADVQDAWPETFERILPRFVWVMLGMVRAARRIYREADGVSAVAMRYIELARKYGCNAPMHLAGHAIKMSHGERGEHGEISTRSTCSTRLKLVYVGNMSLSYDLETLIKAVQELPEVMLDIAGNGPDLKRLEELATSRKHGGTEERRIKFWGYLGEKELGELLQSCDVGLIPMFPSSCVGVPGKLADYASAGLRIIESLGGECGEIVARYQAGCHYEAGNVESLKAAIEKEGSREDKVGSWDGEGFAKAFDAQVVMDAYVKWIDGLFVCKNQWGGTVEAQ